MLAPIFRGLPAIRTTNAGLCGRRLMIQLVLLAGWVLPVDAAPLALSLDEALERGLNASLTLKQAELQQEASAAAVGISRSQFHPKLDAVGLASWAQVGSSIGFISNLPTVGDLNFDLSDNGYAVIQNSFGNIGLALRYPLVDFERGPLLAAAKALDQSSEARVLEQRRQSRFAITNAYLKLQLADALIPIWLLSIDLTTNLLNDAEALLEGGLGARIDVFQARALLSADQSGLSSARSSRAIAASALARLLDLPASQRLEASDPLRAFPPWPLNLEASVVAATSNRPALDVIRQAQIAAEAKVQAARGSRMPRIGVLLGGGINGNSLNVPVFEASSSLSNVPVAGEVNLPVVRSSGSASGSFYDYGILFNLRQPLFDGGLSAQSTALAHSQAQEQRLLLKQREQVIIQAVETFWHTNRSAGETMRASRDAEIASEEAVRDAQLRYRAGIAPITELLLVKRDLQAARTARAVAIQQWNFSRAGLELETGLR